ncbi:MAG TPA: sigma 54-interacting transcriptional regulator [Firmicutes bacterium]|nr:sigma 54-interacting transcriptional regulator [Bacillota bacterium]
MLAESSESYAAGLEPLIEPEGGLLPAAEVLIRQSQERCRQYGLLPDATFLSPIPTAEEIVRRRRTRKELIDVAEPFMRMVLGVSATARFLITLVDADGYVLSIAGDSRLQAAFRKHNFFVGARWRENEVGTSAIVIALLARAPVQVVGEQHYCTRFHPFTCAATPLITKEGELLGCLCMSGHKANVYPNTLGMTIAIGEAITKQVELRRALADVQFSNRCQAAIIDSIFSGFMLIDRNGNIAQMNEVGGKIFGVDATKSIGKHITEIVNSRPVVLDVFDTGVGWTDREFFIDSKRGLIRLIKTAIPIKNASGEVVYVIETFREMDRVHEFATKVMGARARFTFDDIIGNSCAIRQAVDLAALAAEGDSTVLLQGETGTGKEIFAQAIHNASSRSRGPYLALNCAAIPRDLMESELFGYVEGAFSGASKSGRAGKFELAAGGTLLLDEIGDLPLDMQAKLLRVLQDKAVMRIGGNKVIPVDVRIIAATNKDLEEEVQRGNFRRDLFYRLNVVSIKLPPLRDRKEDIPLLAHHFLKKTAARLNKSTTAFTREALLALTRYEWPGNIRELENAIERALNAARSTEIEPDNLPANIVAAASAKGSGPNSTPHLTQAAEPSSGMTLQELEHAALARALAANKGNIARTARQLGVSRTTLYKKVKKYKLKSTV